MAGAPAPDLSWITDELAIGGRIPAGGAQLLAELGVGFVVDLRDEACDDVAELSACGLRFLRLPVADHHAPSQDQLDAGVRFARLAQAAGARLLIHCQHGIGRSATLALCVLTDRGLEPMAALRRTKDARERVSPSPPQYEAWAAWLRRRRPGTAAPPFDVFRTVAYRHLGAGS
jgi:hypothetical protein